MSRDTMVQLSPMNNNNYYPIGDKKNHITIVHILQEGFISKKGVFNTSFQKRWFILDSLGKFRYYRVDTGQLKGEILLSDIIEVSCNAFLTAEIAKASQIASSNSINDTTTNTTSSGTSRFFNFRYSVSDTTPTFSGTMLIDSDLKNSKSSNNEADKGFFIKTANRLYVFQAETAGEAANWVITLRKFIAK